MEEKKGMSITMVYNNDIYTFNFDEELTATEFAEKLHKLYILLEYHPIAIKRAYENILDDLNEELESIVTDEELYNIAKSLKEKREE